MPTSTYNLISSNVLSSSSSSVTFSSLPSSYRDIVVVISPNLTVPGNSPKVRFNSDSGNNYSVVVARATTSAVQAFNYANQANTWITFTGIDASGSSAILNIMDYSATNKHKTMISRSNAPEYGADMMTSKWASTSAITSIEIFCEGYSFASGSTFYLYGIAS